MFGECGSAGVSGAYPVGGRVMVTVSAPAKVNLTLEVGPRRADGYHELVTIFRTLELHDTVRVTEAPGDIALQITGPQAADLPAGPENLVWRAARLLAEATGREKAGVLIELEKRIPVAAGLGGGSADAAATLRACARLWDIDDEQLLNALAYKLGADVAFFLIGGAALGRGRGELLKPLHLPPLWVTLANPGVPVSTAAVYEKLALLRARRMRAVPAELGARTARFLTVLQTEGVEAAAPLLVNDLATAAVEVAPQIVALTSSFYAEGALGSEVSGSGATVFALARDATQAEALAEAVRQTASWTWWGRAGEDT
jgi:4-diphosphocytidyl-2-C-methyl-D-erythritol kinase